MNCLIAYPLRAPRAQGAMLEEWCELTCTSLIIPIKLSGENTGSLQKLKVGKCDRSLRLGQTWYQVLLTADSDQILPHIQVFFCFLFFLSQETRKESYNLFYKLDKILALGPLECSNSALHGRFTRGKEAVI